MAENKTSPWVWVGCGCAVVVVLLAVAVGGAGLFVAREVKDMADTMSDPERRQEKVLEVLGAEEVPPGFHPMLAISIPFVMDIAMLSDLPPDEDGEPQEFGEAGLIYLYMKIGQEKNVRELREYFAGERDDVSILEDNNINIDVDEVLGRGRLERGDAEVLWMSHRGDVDAMGSGSGDAVVAMMLFGCPGDDRMRLAIWFENVEVDPGAAVVDEDGTAEALATAPAPGLEGTPGDPAEIERFASYLNPCPTG